MDFDHCITSSYFRSTNEPLVQVLSTENIVTLLECISRSMLLLTPIPYGRIVPPSVMCSVYTSLVTSQIRCVSHQSFESIVLYSAAYST